MDALKIALILSAIIVVLQHTSTFCYLVMYPASNVLYGVTFLFCISSFMILLLLCFILIGMLANPERHHWMVGEKTPLIITEPLGL